MDIKEIKEYLEKVKPPTNDNWIPLQPWWKYLQFLLKRVEELESQKTMTISRLEGIVEGMPTSSVNFLQRIDELRRIEIDLKLNISMLSRQTDLAREAETKRMEAERRVKELERKLNSWALELKLNSWVCAYCGQRFPKDVLMAPLEVANHTLTCDKNPMVEELRQVKSCLKKLKEFVDDNALFKISRYDRHHLDMDESKDGKYVLYSDYEVIIKQLRVIMLTD